VTSSGGGGEGCEIECDEDEVGSGDEAQRMAATTSRLFSL
jgi:hypothetical protein